MAGYVERLREARARGTSAPSPDLAGGVFWLALSLLAYIYFAIEFRPEGAPLHFHFVSESGAITALSAVLLSSSAVLLSSSAALAFAAGFLGRTVRRPGAWPWFLFAAALLFLAIDEQMQFHEDLGAWLNTVASRRGATLSWNDILVIGYGVAAIPFVMALLPTLAATPKVPEYLGVALLMYALHTLVDSSVEPPVPSSVIVEESLKIFAGAALAVAMFAGLVAQVEVVDAAGSAARPGRGKK